MLYPSAVNQVHRGMFWEAMYHRLYLLLLFCMLFYQGLSPVHLVVPVHRLCLLCSSCLWHQVANSEPALRLCMH